MTSAHIERPFRWGSALGIAVALFLLHGLLNVLSAIFVPLSLHLGGSDAFGGAGLVLGANADAAILGRSFSQIESQDPALWAYLVTSMDTMCMMMMPFGILQLALAWFALRRAQWWAFWAIVIADLSFIPYYLAIVGVYARYGVPVAQSVSDSAFFFIVFPLVLTVLPLILGWIGLKRAQLAPAAA